MFAPVTTFYKQSDFWTISYFSLSGEMSEKLSRCRKELAAAIDRAMEDLSIPFLPSQDTNNNQDSDLPIVQLSTPPNADIFNSKGEVISPTVYCPQPSSAVSSPEKENPLLRSNLFPVAVTSSIPCTKREPLMSKENTWLHPPIFMADKQYFISLQDSERWKKGQVRYALPSQAWFVILWAASEFVFDDFGSRGDTRADSRYFGIQAHMVKKQGKAKSKHTP